MAPADWRQASVNLAILALAHNQSVERGEASRRDKRLAMVAAAERVIAAAVSEQQPAKGLDLPQRPMRVICAIGVTQPQPHPANAHAAPSEQPTPSIA